MKSAHLEVLPLGGLGEFGLNMMAYRLGTDILIVDCGIMFPSTETPGVDLLLPDTSYLDAHRDQVRGIVLTHGHEDHIGALPFVLREHPVPVYGTKLTLGICRRRLEEHGLLDKVDLREVAPGSESRLARSRSSSSTFPTASPTPSPSRSPLLRESCSTRATSRSTKGRPSDRRST